MLLESFSSSSPFCSWKERGLSALSTFSIYTEWWDGIDVWRKSRRSSEFLTSKIYKSFQGQSIPNAAFICTKMFLSNYSLHGYYHLWFVLINALLTCAFCWNFNGWHSTTNLDGPPVRSDDKHAGEIMFFIRVKLWNAPYTCQIKFSHLSSCLAACVCVGGVAGRGISEVNRPPCV